MENEANPAFLAARGQLGGYGSDRAYTAQAEQPASAPFTALAMQHLHSTTSQASEIASRLYELRDRLFGPSPVTGAQSIEKTAQSQGFADAFTRQANEASNLLATIDRLTIELSNRL